MRKPRWWPLAGLSLLVVGYAAWSRSGRGWPHQPVDLRLLDTVSFGQDVGRGNLLGIQPYMVPSDYAHESRFAAKLDGYLKEAHQRGFLGENTVVVFPEYLAAWLVAAGEKRAIYRAETVDEATQIMVLSNLASFAWWVLRSQSPGRSRYALFRMKAKPMAAMYQRVFSRLAKSYGVTVVAGSTILPDPRVRNGVVLPGSGPLYNVTAVYGPDGRAMAPIVRKVFLTEEEQPFLVAGRVEEIPVFETAAGRLGVLICADSWHPESYQRLREQGAEIIAVVSYAYPDKAWDRTWDGREGPETRNAEPGGAPMVEGEAWMRYTLPGGIQRSGASAGLTVFLRGRLWDLGSDGAAIAVHEGQVHRGPRVDGAVITNLWLGHKPKGEGRGQMSRSAAADEISRPR